MGVLMHPPPTTYCPFSKWRPSAIMDFKIFAVFIKNSNYRYFYVDMQNWSKNGDPHSSTEWHDLFSKWRPSAILDFRIFAIFVKNSNLRLFLCRRAKFGEDRTIRCQVIAYCRFSKWRPSAILDFHIFAIFIKNSNCAYFYVYMVKIGWSAAELLRIFNFQNGSRSPYRHIGSGMTS